MYLICFSLGNGSIVGEDAYCEATSPDTNTPTDFYLRLGSYGVHNTINWIIHLPNLSGNFLFYSFDFYRPKRSFGQGNIFTPVCHSVHRGGVPAPNFRGGGGVGGCLLQIFGGGPPIFGIRSPFGRYASYWNAFLFLKCFH